MKAQMKTTKYKDYMYKTWTAKNADTEVEKNGEKISAEEQSELVQDMLE